VGQNCRVISFGFTIYKFFQYTREQGHAAENRWLGPREYALVLIGIGLFSLLIATLQSRHELRLMRKHYDQVPFSLANIVAGMVAILGVLAFIAVMLRK
jgi:inner membrane protein YidH